MRIGERVEQGFRPTKFGERVGEFDAARAVKPLSASPPPRDELFGERFRFRAAAYRAERPRREAEIRIQRLWILGLASELEAEMARHVAGYECEWKATVEDPQRVELFRTFVNDDRPDPSVVFLRQRDQHRPASWSEKAPLLEKSA
jgi:hypothetical protein